jgi:uncharacterized membrane protein HdeD (DUF308 family)
LPTAKEDLNMDSPGFVVRVDDTEAALASSYAETWWLFLVMGILWLVLGFMILSLRPVSISVCVILIAVAFWLGALSLFAIAYVGSGGLRVLAIILGVLAIGAGIAALVWSHPTLLVLGVLVAWYLLVRGLFDIVIALMNTHVRGWWLQLVAGIVAIALGAWAIGNPDRSVLLIISIIGVWTIFKGVSDLVAAFHYRDLKKSLAS